MAARIKLDTKGEAESILETVFHRRNYTVDTRDALAARLDSFVRKAFADAKVPALIEDEN